MTTTGLEPNGWVFIYELNGSGFKSSCSHLNFRFRACFEQRVPWYSGNYRVWIHSENAYVTWQEHTFQEVLLSIQSNVVFGIQNYSFTKTILSKSNRFENVIYCWKLFAYCRVPNCKEVKFYLEWSKWKS